FLSFFFSSRRRHTRCLSDWSSDVCSSDLQQADVNGRVYRPDHRVAGSRDVHMVTAMSAIAKTSTCAAVHHRQMTRMTTSSTKTRSEERRVGKEWRNRTGWDRSRKKKKDKA